MRILVVTQHYPPENSGNASRVSDMARQLALQGVRVTVLAPHPTFPTGSFKRTWRLRRRSEREGVEVVNLWGWQPQAKDPGFLSRTAYYLTFPLHAALWVLFNAGRFDAVVSSMPPVFTGIPGMAAARARRKPLVVEVRDLWIDAAVGLGFVKEESLVTRMSRRFEAACYRRAALIGTTTEDLKRKLVARYKVQGKPVVVVPNGVDTTRFAPVAVPKQPRFTYAGNVGHAQDLENVLRALVLLRRTHPHAKVVIAGDGDTRAALQALAKELALEDAVEFPGVIPRDQVPALLSGSVAGLAPLRNHPSLEYAVPTKAYEYLSCGVPFLGTGIGEIRSLAKESGGGRIAENTPESVAAEMAWLLDHPEEAARMGETGRAYVREHYDRGGITARYLAALKEALGRA